MYHIIVILTNILVKKKTNIVIFNCII